VPMSGDNFARRYSVVAETRRKWSEAEKQAIVADRAAAVTTLITTAKLNDVDPLAWLADVLACIADTPQNRLPDLLPWEWKRSPMRAAA
jgi:transposase IS66-like protein